MQTKVNLSKVNLSYEDLQILIQCIESLNFSGKNVVQVGLLGDKLYKALKKIEKDMKHEPTN